MKIPCIRCNKDKWDRIKSYLIKWCYNIDSVSSDWDSYPILVLNYRKRIGICSNIHDIDDMYHSYYNREMMLDTNKFLTRAAKLMGFEYPDEIKYKIKLRCGDIVGIKPGMIIEGLNYNDLPETAIVFPMKSSLAFIPVGEGYWNKDIYAILKEVTCIKDVTPSDSIDSRLGGDIIWEKSKVIELTIDEALKEIADKRGVDVESIRIKV